MSAMQSIKDILQENLDVDPSKVTEDATLESLELDSLDIVELVCDLEEKEDVELGDGVEDLKTVGEIANYVEGLKA